MKKGIKATPVVKSTLDPDIPLGSRTEFLAVQAKVNEINICVVAFYSALCSNPHFCQSYETVLLELLETGFDRLYVIGDFNNNITSLLSSVNLTDRRLCST